MKGILKEGFADRVGDGPTTCPVGITTHNPALQNGFDIEARSRRVEHYVRNTVHDLQQMLVATGKRCPSQLGPHDLYIPTGSDLWQAIPQSAIWGAVLAWGLLTAASGSASNTGSAATGSAANPGIVKAITLPNRPIGSLVKSPTWPTDSRA